MFQWKGVPFFGGALGCLLRLLTITVCSNYSHYMKNYTRYPLLIVLFLLLLVPVYTQGQGSVSLIMAPILAAVHDDTNPDPPLPPPPILDPVEWQGRIWQQNDDGNRYNWYDAIHYCDTLDLNGYSDWMLPSKDELKSLVVCTNGTPTPLPDCHADGCVCGDQIDDPYKGFESPTIDKAFTCRPDNYWTSSPNPADDARRVNFERGGAAAYERSAEYYVRCVRPQ